MNKKNIINKKRILNKKGIVNKKKVLNKKGIILKRIILKRRILKRRILNKRIILNKDVKFNNKNKICCFYAYFEKNKLYKNNFDYFLKNGILNHVNYIIIINGKYTIKIPKINNIKILLRKNIGYDFGAYSYAIKKLKEEYDYYFFINTSVKGPYLHNNDKPWTDYFLNLFNENVKLVGTSINIYARSKFTAKYDLKKIYNKDPPYTHIQSMFFCIDKEYFNFLKKNKFFNEEELNNKKIDYIIAKKEFGLTQILLKRGYNINSILPYYQNLDYRSLNQDINPTSRGGNIYHKNAYFGRTIDPYEIIFIKTNRNLS